jgi:hypothetical protein
LFEVYDRVAPRNAQRAAIDTACLVVGRGSSGSTIEAWDIESEKLGRHDKRHTMLLEYVNNGTGVRLQVAQNIRPHIERYLRVACPDKFRAGEMLRDFRNRARAARSGGTPIMSDQRFDQLDRIVNYTNDFHHDTGGTPETAVINDTELVTFVRLALDFVRV